MGPAGGPWSVSAPQVVDVPGVGGCPVSIVLVGGSLAVLPGAGPDAHIEVSGVSGPPLAISFDGRTLRVEHHKEPDGSLLAGLRRMLDTRAYPSARIAVTLPAEAGPVSVTTVTASVYAEAVPGRLRVVAGSGAVDINRAVGDLDIKTGVAAVTLRRCAARRIALTTVSGALAVDLAQPDCLLTTRGGSLTVTAPAGGLDLSATTRGRVSVDGRDVLPDDVQDAVPGEQTAAPRSGVPTLHHADGDRALVIKAKLRSGDVTVTRGGAMPPPPALPGAGA